MSQENVEIIKAFYTSDLAGMMSYVHPDAVFSEAGGLPYSGNYIGPEGLRDLLKRIRDEYKLSVEDRWQAIDAGEDRVLLLFEAKFTSLKSGAQIETRITELYRVNDGLITGNDIYYKDPGAISALHDQIPTV